MLKLDFFHVFFPHVYCFFSPLHHNKFMYEEYDSHGEVSINTVIIKVSL